MSGARRPKRKAAAAANDAIVQIKKLQQQQEEEDDDSSQAAVIAINNNGAAEDPHHHQQQPNFTDPLLFCGGNVALPQEIFQEILDFLPKPDLVHGASMVSTAWNNASKNPFLWPVLDADIWKKYPPNRRSGGPSPRMAFSSMRKFHAFLRRPQFARLQTLVPPDIYRTRVQVFELISQSCPLVQDLDLSGRTSTRLHSMVAYPQELVLLPRLFPQLQKIKICMRRLQADDVAEFARRMGDRLVELDVRAYQADPVGGHHDLLDSTLEAVAQHCPNLQVLSYDFTLSFGSPGRLTERGPLALLQHCPKLRSLELTLPPPIRVRVMKWFRENGYAQRGLQLRLPFQFPPVFVNGRDEENSDEEDGL